jgi:uncharacterized protein DUF3618
MDQVQSEVRESVDVAQRSPEQIRAEIDRTRAELGATVAALAQKADVKEQARRRATRTKQAVAAKKDEVVTTGRERRVWVPAAGIGALLLLLVFLRRR